MPEFVLGTALSLAALAGVSLGVTWQWLRTRTRTRALLARVSEQQEVFAEYDEVMAALRGHVSGLAAALDAAERKASGYFATIEGVLGERDTWQRMYRQQSAEHGNAQALMMADNAYLISRLKEKGVEVKGSPLLAEVHQLYQDTHINPVTQVVEPPAQPAGQPAKALPMALGGPPLSADSTTGKVN